MSTARQGRARRRFVERCMRGGPFLSGTRGESDVTFTRGEDWNWEGRAHFDEAEAGPAERVERRGRTEWARRGEEGVRLGSHGTAACRGTSLLGVDVPGRKKKGRKDCEEASNARARSHVRRAFLPLPRSSSSQRVEALTSVRAREHFTRRRHRHCLAHRVATVRCQEPTQ